jgi:hypothetical protein
MDPRQMQSLKFNKHLPPISEIIFKQKVKNVIVCKWMLVYLHVVYLMILFAEKIIQCHTITKFPRLQYFAFHYSNEQM